jgi:hypothetical protein
MNTSNNRNFSIDDIFYFVANMHDDDFKPKSHYKYFVQVENWTEIPNEQIYFSDENEELYFNGKMIPPIILKKAKLLPKGQGLYYDSCGSESLPF